MSLKHRTLPSWMSKKKEEKVKEKEPLKSRRKRKSARAVFYCMNEKELVEAAVSCLTSAACEDVTNQKVEDNAAHNTVKMKENHTTSKAIAMLVTEEESSDCSSDGKHSTYVSETDLDVTELETVQYTKSPQHWEPEGQGSGPVQDLDGLVNDGLEVEKTEEHSQMPAEEDDALRLVREIFFT